MCSEVAPPAFARSRESGSTSEQSAEEAMRFTDRPIRVLVENADPAELWADERILRRAGFEVGTCQGPEGPADAFPFGRCMLAAEGRCPLVDEADVVVFGLHLTHPSSREVLQAHRRRHHDKPTCIEATSLELRRMSDLVAGYERITFPATGSRLLEAVGNCVTRTSPRQTREETAPGFS